MTEPAVARRQSAVITPRRRTRTVMKGTVPVGSEHPVVVQSMCVAATEAIEAPLAEIAACVRAGAELMRVAVPYTNAAKALPEIVRRAPVPIIADIHFNPRMAFEAIEAGAAVIRINPGNISDPEIVRQIVQACRDKGLAMRIGVNSGSIMPRQGITVEEIEKEMVEQMVDEGVRWVSFVEDLGFSNFVVSFKSSDPLQTIAANRRAAPLLGDVPIHLGVTHAGIPEHARLKTALAFGALLSEGIGDTIRVSFTAPPVEEVKFAVELLGTLRLRRLPIEVIACPSCGRADVDVEKLTREVEARLTALGKRVTVSVLGCAVNGPGEAAECDFGIVAGAGKSWVYRGRQQLSHVENERVVDELLRIIDAALPAPAPPGPP